MSSARLALPLVALLVAYQAAASDTDDNDSGFSAAASPAETLRRYFVALDQRNRNSNLGLYTPATRQMLSSRRTTDAQMANLVNTFQHCRAEKARIDVGMRFAVIRYPVDQRACSPWFFEYIDGAWALDLTMMQQAIRFSGNNAWRFDQGVNHPYKFAFEDWSFDSQGFPASSN